MKFYSALKKEKTTFAYTEIKFVLQFIQNHDFYSRVKGSDGLYC